MHFSEYPFIKWLWAFYIDHILIFLYVHLKIYKFLLYVCVFICVHVGVHVCVEARGQHQRSHLIAVYLMYWCNLIEPGARRFARLPGQWAPGIHLSVLPGLLLCFYVDAGVLELRSSCLCSRNFTDITIPYKVCLSIFSFLRQGPFM